MHRRTFVYQGVRHVPFSENLAFCFLETPVLRLAFLPYYRKFSKGIQLQTIPRPWSFRGIWIAPKKPASATVRGKIQYVIQYGIIHLLMYADNFRKTNIPFYLMHIRTCVYQGNGTMLLFQKNFEYVQCDRSIQ